MGNRHVASLAFEAVDSLGVFSGGYSAELGRATGGVTSAHTRTGTVFELLWGHK